MQKKPKSEYFYGFFAGVRMRAKHWRANTGNTIAGKHRQTKCKQEDAPAVSNFQLRQHTSARIFSYTENQNLRTAAASLTAPPVPVIVSR